jgi:hypothetical protein
LSPLIRRASTPNNVKAEYQMNLTIIGYNMHIHFHCFCQQELFLKAIDLHPKFATAYSGLASTLFPGGSIRLLGDKLMTQEALFRKALNVSAFFKQED